MAAWPDRIAANLRAGARRRAGRVIDLAGCTVLLPAGPWPMYAVPDPGWAPDRADLRAALDVLRAYDLPPAIEWVEESAPALAGIISSDPLIDLQVSRHPLLVCDDPAAIMTAELAADIAGAVTIDLVGIDDRDRGDVLRVPAVAFATDDAEIDETPDDVADFHARRLASGTHLTAAARIAGTGPVSAGSAQIEADGAEIVAVGTLPAWTGRGLGSAVCTMLAMASFDRGVAYVYLSATDGRVAKLYARIGFRQVGVFCSASPAAPRAQLSRGGSESPAT